MKLRIGLERSLRRKKLKKKINTSGNKELKQPLISLPRKNIIFYNEN